MVSCASLEFDLIPWYIAHHSYALPNSFVQGWKNRGFLDKVFRFKGFFRFYSTKMTGHKIVTEETAYKCYTDYMQCHILNYNLWVLL